MSDPPLTVGAVGALRSSATVEAGVTGVHADTFPAASTDRNSTVVVPSTLTATELPLVADDHAPPLNEVWYW